MPIAYEKDIPLSLDAMLTSDYALPDFTEIVADAGQAPALGAIPAVFGIKQLVTYQQTGQLGLGSILTNIGVPTANAFKTAMQGVGFDAAAVVRESVKDAVGGALAKAFTQIASEQGGKVMEAGAEVGAGIAIDFVSAIPVAGWIVKLAWNLGKSIANIVKVVKETDSYKPVEAIYPDTVFNPELDLDATNLFILDRLLSTKDWTGIFMPPGLGKESWEPDYFATAKLQSGWSRITTRGPRGAFGEVNGKLTGGWLGMVPGTGTLHQGIEFEREAVREQGSLLLPTPRRMGLWLWKHIIGRKGKVFPSMYTVYADDVANAWSGYLSTLRDYVARLDASGATRRAILAKYNRSGSKGSEIFGWGTSTKEVPDVESFAPVIEARTLRKRQLAYLDTIMVAYVDGSYAAIQNDPQLRARWAERRNQLLKHPARCDVDLASVPDEIYRWDLEQSRRGMGCVTSGGGGGVVFDPGQEPPRAPSEPPRAPSRVVPDDGEPEPPDGSPGAGGIDGDGSGGGGMGMVAVGAALIGGLAWALKGR